MQATITTSFTTTLTYKRCVVNLIGETLEFNTGVGSLRGELVVDGEDGRQYVMDVCGHWASLTTGEVCYRALVTEARYMPDVVGLIDTSKALLYYNKKFKISRPPTAGFIILSGVAVKYDGTDSGYSGRGVTRVRFFHGSCRRLSRLLEHAFS